MPYMAYVWLGLLAIFLLMEAQTVALVSLWFAAGALAALVAALLEAELWLQIVLFVAVSGVLLLALRPVLRKFFTPKLAKTNVDAVIGSQGLVTEKIDNVTGTGQVKLGGMYWTARSTSGENIGVDTIIKVDRVEGVKAFVSPAEELVIGR